ncbi:hybrid sensor histidine kinase/response regulator [Massilia yuzhufengensis]|uniref:histidine kinase n=1 Tax=Massilia yuzhufengensis TaxID=1164594 RepID=A0A1I1K331_9BURK|nr:ATP-binding protein [Massilia yuzhufengensis]SFC55136.1 PAS domain S-box-containing protein [Massilia yuzhufengensis]
MPHPPHAAIDGDNAMRARIRRHDWRQTPLGPPEHWPPALRTAVDMMLHSAFPMFMAWGPDLVFLYNDAYAPLLGQKHGRALGERFCDLWAEVWSEMVPLIDRALSGKPVYFEDMPMTVVRRGYPERATFTFSHAPLIGNDGQVAGLFCTVMETTRRVAAERRAAFELTVSDALRPLSSAEEVIATASVLLGGELHADRVVYAEMNQASGRFTVPRGWARDGRGMTQPSYSLDGYGPAVAAALRAGDVVRIQDTACDVRTVGYRSAYATDGVGSLLVVPLVKANRLTACLGIDCAQPRHWSDDDLQLVRDLAERTWAAAETARAQAELRAERDRSRNIFDTIAEGFALFDASWTVLEMNAEGLRICRMQEQDVVGRNHWEAFPHTVDAEPGPMYRAVMRTRVAGSAEHSHVFPDGVRIWTEVRAYPMQDGGLAAFFRDITDRKLAEEKLVEADRRKDEFLAMLAHELRNPLAPISAAAELLRIGTLDEARVRQGSNIIGRQVRHMTRLVDDLLDVSRVTRGLITLERTQVGMRGVVQEAVEQVRPAIDARRQRLAVRLPPSWVLVEGDRARLVQVVANVLGNAAKYTPEACAIELDATVHGDSLQVRVRDEGIGMDQDLTSRVFDLFTQAERSPDRSQGGLGLGLALVRNLVELHGGTVGCSSPGLGQGSTFTIELPLLPGAVAEAEPEEAVPAGHAASLTVLVVDDNVDAAETLGLLLAAHGHQVMVEHEPLAALARARAAAPDVCLLDIGLPGMDGHELARSLRAQPETAGAVLVAITGYGQQQDRNDAFAAGFHHHLVKPVDIEQLARLLDGVAAR